MKSKRPFPTRKRSFFFTEKVLFGQVAAYNIQMLDFLPQNVKNAIKNLNFHYLYELRIRANQAIIVNYDGNYRYLGEYGLTERAENAISCSITDIQDCVYRAGNYSVYSVEEQLKQGFITAENGERLGIAGEYVFEKGQPLSLRNFSSLCIRVPHEIIGSAQVVYDRCMRDRIRSILLMSPPGLGKTTILRDLARILSEKSRKNILICDERGEISVGDIGSTCDVMRYADKITAFTSGIRAMRPDVIITDELSAIDCTAVRKATQAGIAVIASAHFSAMEKVENAFKELFERYVLLDSSKIGKIACIYDNKGQELT